MLGQTYDIAIIGGGINGCAIARDAAGRGLSVFLCEQGDLGGGASSASLKLVHGGLRHLEKLQLGQLRVALAEQEILLRAAPHLVRPHRFVIPHHEGLWPASALRGGLFAYDHVVRRSLPPRRAIALDREPGGEPLRRHFGLAFEYSDCVADDSRLVIASAVDARARGAIIQPHLGCVIAEREGKLWRLALEFSETAERLTVQARILVNASGASLSHVLDHVIHTDRRASLRFVKESHIIVRRRLPDGRAYVFPNSDGRIIYALPIEGDFALIGSTREGYSGGPAAEVTEREIAYLADVANQYLQTPLGRKEIVHQYAGVRALSEDGGAPDREAKRDHVIAVDAPPRGAAIVSVYGGTLTTHRRVAEQVVDRIARIAGASKRWTARAVLPGGNFPRDGAGDVARALRAAYPFISEAHAARLVGAYGTRAPMILTGARGEKDLGIRFGGDLTEVEVAYLMAEEWARTADDVLWRRSKLGLRFGRGEVDALGDWMAENRVAKALPEAV